MPRAGAFPELPAEPTLVCRGALRLTLRGPVAEDRPEHRMTDAELRERCRRGERDAQRRLYEQCSDRVYGLLLRMTRNADDAFDLAQETFIRVFEKIDTFDGASSLATWVYRIAVNEALQFLRRQSLAARTIPKLAARDRGEATPLADDTRLDVAEAVAKLPPLERVLIELRYSQGLSYDEMAAILEKPPGTIGSGLNRAREILRQLLDNAYVPKG
jgi:RNA polymerase sigma-70 factor (ECF subfamily)